MVTFRQPAVIHPPVFTQGWSHSDVLTPSANNLPMVPLSLRVFRGFA